MDGREDRRACCTVAQRKGGNGWMDAGEEWTSIAGDLDGVTGPDSVDSSRTPSATRLFIGRKEGEA